VSVKKLLRISPVTSAVKLVIFLATVRLLLPPLGLPVTSAPQLSAISAGRWGTSPVTALMQVQARTTAEVSLPDRGRLATLAVDTVICQGTVLRDRSAITVVKLVT